MKQSLILILLASFFSFTGFSQEESEGIKSLKRKCKEVRKQLEEKYGEEIISHDCDVSVKYGYALESIYSFKSNPNCKSKVTAHFTKKYKEITKIEENLVYERFAYLRKERALNLLKPIFNGFDKLEIKYTPFEFSINLIGSLNKENHDSLNTALELLEKVENKDILLDKSHPDSGLTLIPRFYCYIVSKSIDTTMYPFTEIEKNTLPESVVKLEKKWNVIADIFSEYSIYTNTEEIIEGKGLKHLQRKLSAYNPEKDDYSISVGGFNYLNK